MVNAWKGTFVLSWNQFLLLLFLRHINKRKIKSNIFVVDNYSCIERQNSSIWNAQRGVCRYVCMHVCMYYIYMHVWNKNINGSGACGYAVWAWGRYIRFKHTSDYSRSINSIILPQAFEQWTRIYLGLLSFAILCPHFTVFMFIDITTQNHN